MQTDISGLRRITTGSTSRIDLREQVLNFPSQPVITKDNVTIGIDAVLYYRVTDPQSEAGKRAAILEAEGIRG